MGTLMSMDLVTVKTMPDLSYVCRFNLQNVMHCIFSNGKKSANELFLCSLESLGMTYLVRADLYLGTRLFCSVVECESRRMVPSEFVGEQTMESL